MSTTEKSREVILEELAREDERINPDIWYACVKAAVEGNDYEAVAVCGQIVEALEADRDGKPPEGVKSLFLVANKALTQWWSDHGQAGGAISAPTQALPSTILHKSDEINFAAVNAYSTIEHWKEGLNGFAYGCEQSTRHLSITVGLPHGDRSKDLWEFLRKGGAPMVKAHFALWARWYEDRGSPGQYITVSVNQFCSDVGYAPHKNGGFKRERKQAAMRILEGLTTIEMSAIYTRKGKQSAARLRGPLWARGLIGEENDRYTDLFGQIREGSSDLWEPAAFSYAPGPWFTNPEFAPYNKAIGKLSVGLLQLSNHTDQWAILIGGYLATIMRAEQYAPKAIRVGTILQRTGLAQSSDAMRRESRQSDKLARALDRLREVGVIKTWSIRGFDSSDRTDPDNPEELVDYYQDDPYPEGDWRAQIVIVEFHNEEDQARLQSRQQAISTAEKRKRGRPRKTEAVN